MKAIASEGYLVIVPEMPINMAVFNPNIADKIIAYYPKIDYWIISGHSVGGTMAAQFTFKNPNLIDGLMIWASYPSNSSDLSESSIPVISLYGSNDSSVSDIEISLRENLLPESTNYVRIVGGDHHQFGSYEIKSDEDHALISQDSPHKQIIQSTLNFLMSIP